MSPFMNSLKGKKKQKKKQFKCSSLRNADSSRYRNDSTELLIRSAVVVSVTILTILRVNLVIYGMVWSWPLSRCAYTFIPEQVTKGNNIGSLNIYLIQLIFTAPAPVAMLQSPLHYTASQCLKFHLAQQMYEEPLDIA